MQGYLSYPNAIYSGFEKGEGHISFLGLAYSAIIQGTWGIVMEPGSLLGYYFANSSHADGDELNYKVYLSKGTYTFVCLGPRSTDQGILDLEIDSVSKGTVDTYGAPSQNIRHIISDIVITTSGLCTVGIKANGKNASSSNYYIRPVTLCFYRTA